MFFPQVHVLLPPFLDFLGRIIQTGSFPSLLRKPAECPAATEASSSGSPEKGYSETPPFFPYLRELYFHAVRRVEPAVLGWELAPLEKGVSGLLPCGNRVGAGHGFPAGRSSCPS